MSTSSDSAEQIVRLSLEGIEVVAKLSGSMAKNAIAMLYAISKDTSKKTKGRTRLETMLKSGSNLDIFSIKKEDFENFRKEAKRYGILYCALFNKNSKKNDGVVDLVIRQEDAVRVNRVVERYNITRVDVEKVEQTLDEADKEKMQIKDTGKLEIDKNIQEKNTSEDMLNILLNKQTIKEENENINPSQIQTSEQDYLSENLLKTNEKSEKNKIDEKPSIRLLLNEIKAQKEEKEKIKEKEEIPKKIETNEKKQIKHKEPKKKRRKKERSKNI